MARQIIAFGKKFRQLLFNYDWEVVELQGAVLMVVWGIWLALPFSTFASTTASASAYSGLSQFASELIWAIFFLVFGVAQIWSITTGNVKMRRLLIFAACLFWIYVSITVGISRPSAGLIPFTAVTSFFLAVNYLRLGIPIIDKGRQLPR